MERIYIYIPLKYEQLLKTFQTQWLSTDNSYMIVTGLYDNVDNGKSGNSEILSQSKELIPYKIDATFITDTITYLKGFIAEAYERDIPAGLPDDILLLDNVDDIKNL